MLRSVNKRVFYTTLSGVVILLGAFIAIQYAKGAYRVTTAGFRADTGLLAANSFPTGAQVKVNGRLVSATDDTLYLEPDTYDVEIIKDGYQPWRKQLEVKSELVTQTDALLFPIAPSLSTLTFTGAQNLLPSPDGQKILYYTASMSAEQKNGLYVLELTSSPFPLQKGPRQILQDSPALDLSQIQAIWSPDSTEILILSPNREILLQADRKNESANLSDISFRRKQLLAGWEEEMYLRERQFMKEFPPEIVAIATQGAQNVYFSPDKKRLLYTATIAQELPILITPAVPARSTQQETRTLSPGNMYIYDREEDTNFLIAGLSDDDTTNSKWLLADDVFAPSARSLEASPSAFQTLQATVAAETAQNFARYHTSLYANNYQWFPDSSHLLYVGNNEIKVIGADNTNPTTVYSGPLASNFIYPWPDGRRLIILTSFSPSAPANLYAVELE
ncbi:MAG: PEGA domain-containing protein [Candidatus Pacebacteria bacterium]|nr:PEGA domain-containing protein [Candidatus Paceibacterota bacterium]